MEGNEQLSVWRSVRCLPRAFGLTIWEGSLVYSSSLVTMLVFECGYFGMGAWKGYRYEVLICGTGMGPGMRFGMERRYCRWRAML